MQVFRFRKSPKLIDRGVRLVGTLREAEQRRFEDENRPYFTVCSLLSTNFDHVWRETLALRAAGENESSVARSFGPLVPNLEETGPQCSTQSGCDKYMQVHSG